MTGIEHKVCLLLLMMSTVATGTFFRVPSRSASVRTSSKLSCHDCAGHSDCETLLKHNWTGKCSTEQKCFIRQDPNGIVYRGCADTEKWPKLRFDYNGCGWQRYGWWDNVPVLWCFCDVDLCNTNISGVSAYYGTTIPRVPITGDPIKTEWRIIKGELPKAPHPTPATVVSSRAPAPSGISWDVIEAYLQKMKHKTSTTPPTTTTMPPQEIPTSTSTTMAPTTLPSKHYYPKGTYGIPVLPIPFPWVPPHYHLFPKPTAETSTLSPDKGDLVQDLITCDDKGCSQVCSMLNGGAICGCHPGFTLLSDGLTCSDTDECTRSDLHGCSDLCHNTLGSYTCACPPGLTLSANGRTCYDENECLVDNAGCGHFCTNTVDGYKCGCYEGYKLNVDAHSCDDVNECLVKRGGCNQTCTNTQGSYSCHCTVGYELDADKHKCLDLNECKVNNGGCEQRCHNILGSFRCSCTFGFSLNADRRSCDSVDHCGLNNGGCDHFCEDRLDGPVCSCRTGFQVAADGKKCYDQNECAISNGGCSHLCDNTVGSYSCRCRDGYLLNTDLKSCYDRNECSLNGHGCDHGCVNVDGSYKCSCRDGYKLDTADLRSCIDVDECAAESQHGCSDGCTNTEGSYVCSCKDDFLFKLDADGKTCIEQCPPDFILTSWGSCYKVFSDDHEARSVQDAKQHCQTYHTVADLVSVDTVQEKEFLAGLLATEGEMLDKWQGWWTSGFFDEGKEVFTWRDGRLIPFDSELWGFLKEPYEDTCVWLLQPFYFDFLWGNYYCSSRSGFVCEINISEL